MELRLHDMNLHKIAGKNFRIKMQKFTAMGMNTYAITNYYFLKFPLFYFHTYQYYGLICRFMSYNVQSAPKVLEQQGKFHCFLTEDIEDIRV